MFNKGNKFFFKVNPYWKTIRVSKYLSATAQGSLAEALKLFALESIQSNVFKNLDSMLQSLLRIRGPKAVDSGE